MLLEREVFWRFSTAARTSSSATWQLKSRAMTRSPSRLKTSNKKPMAALQRLAVQLVLSSPLRLVLGVLLGALNQCILVSTRLVIVVWDPYGILKKLLVCHQLSRIENFSICRLKKRLNLGRRLWATIAKNVKGGPLACLGKLAGVSDN